jgi:tyrosyl-tRNA synthetase
VDLFAEAGLARSKSDARRLVQQGGAYVNEEQISDVDRMITLSDLNDGEVLLRAGKKRYHRIVAA